MLGYTNAHKLLRHHQRCLVVPNCICHRRVSSCPYHAMISNTNKLDGSCVFIPLVGRIFTIFRDKHVYLLFMGIFLIGSIICAVSRSSSIFILGRAVNGLGSAGLVTGALLVIRAACTPSIRPLITTVTVSLIPVGSITGPLIAGALTSSIGWRWCK
jgi:MFS family permease